MNTSMLNKGDKLAAIWGPADAEGGQSGGQVGTLGVTDITIDQLAGPMGFYLVAVLKRDAWPDAIVPLHMAETIIPA